MQNRIDEAVGYNVKAARIERKLTQQVLAERAGLTKQSISNIEKGMGANTKTIDRIAQSLDISPLSLYCEPDRREDISFKRVASFPVRTNKSYVQEIQGILDVVADDTRSNIFSGHIQPVLSDFFAENMENLIFQVKSAPYGKENGIVETFRDDLLGNLRTSIYNNPNTPGQDMEDELIEE